MTVTEKLMGVGAWSLNLRPDTPTGILDMLLPERSMGAHVVIVPTRVNLGVLTDAAALAQSRYTGIFLKRRESPLTISGYGVNAWIGGDGQRGRSFGTFGPSSGAGNGFVSTGAFSQWVAALRQDGHLAPGILSSIAGTYTKVHERGYFLEVANAVADRFGAFWRVTNDFRLDFGLPADLCRETPTAMIVRHAADAGRDTDLTGLTGDLDMTRDVEDWVRRVIYWYSAGSVTATGGVADVDVPFRAPGGQPAWLDKIVQDSKVTTSADALALGNTERSRLAVVRDEMTLSSSEYDIGADVRVGDQLLVYDLDRGIYDTTRPVTYRGRIVHPRMIRCVGQTWPIREGMGVWFRRWRKGTSAWELEWVDITPYVLWEDGATAVEVGAKPRGLT